MPKRVLTEYRREYGRLSVIRSRIRLKMRCITYKGGKCVDCGCSAEEFPPSVFEFHHPDPSNKDFGISESSSHTKSFAKLLPELDKVVLLCCRCHRIIHHKWDKERMEARMAAFSSLPNPERGRPNLEPCGLDILPRDRTKVTRPCQTCDKPTDRKKFCSQTCFRLQREQAEWPTDEKLKELVWAKPATTLAEELGVSSVAVKKRCRHRGIETPPRGYWARLAVGK